MIIFSLSADERQLLREYFRRSPIALMRHKAQAVLMRSRAQGTAAIAEWVCHDARTIERWLKDFFLRRMASIFSGMEGNEHASKLTREQKEQIKTDIGQPPDDQGIPKAFWDVPTLKDYVRAQFGVVYECVQSYHYLLKFSKLSFKYPDKRNSREDEEATTKRLTEIREDIKPLLKDPNWMVFASDEVRIQLEAEIRRAWLVKGKRTIVKTERSTDHQNYIGFLDLRRGDVSLFEILRGNQQEMRRVLHLLADQYPDKRMCVVWDNARFHTGKQLKSALKRRGSLSRLHLMHFPPYAPQGNPIEHVWNYGKEKIKNRSGQAFATIKQSFVTALTTRTFAYTI